MISSSFCPNLDRFAYDPSYKRHECSFQVESMEMPKHSRKRDLELGMPACVPQAKSAKHSTAGKAGSPGTAAGKAKSPRKLAKPSDTTAGKAWSPHTAAPKSSDTAAGIPPASETPYHIKDAVLRELIGLGKVQVVTRSSKLSRSGK